MSLEDRAIGVELIKVMKVIPSVDGLKAIIFAFEHPKWLLEKFRNQKDADEDKPYESIEFKGNVLLNEGINNVLIPLLCGGAGTPYNNANARIGVGNGSAGEQATDTGLIGASKFWKAMMTGYPTYGSGQQSVWKSEFAESEAQFAWEEFTVVNAADDTGDNLCRKTESKGTKGAEIWRLTLTITWS